MKRVIAIILLFAVILCSAGNVPAAAASTAVQTDGFRGVWVSSVYNLDFPSKAGLSVDELKRETAAILDGALDMGFNAVILQVKPTGDALYKSDIFPWSDYLTGKQGQAPAGGFDPLKYWVDEAHARGLELHAWINPFRITRGSESAPKQNVTALAENNPARKNPSYAVKYKDGCLYYDPGIPEARNLVIDGVKEIVKNYDVDGIHFDDYFYPGTDFSDSSTYKKYGSGFSNINDWRRDNVDKLIKGTYDAIKAIAPDVSFGVSPFGIWANKSDNSFGSDTAGLQSYYSHYADSRKWVKAGWLDYICPQLYWNIGYKIADYEKLLKWWVDIVSGTKVELYIGQAAYRSGSTAANDPWRGTDEIIRQLDMNRLYPAVKGVIHFRYKSFTDYKPLYDAVKSYFNTGTNGGSAAYDSSLMTMPSRASLTSEPLMVGRPASNTTTTLSKYYILGSSDPSKPLYMNGKLVSDRSPSGYFGIQVELGSGTNTFTFTQSGKSVTRTIKRSSGSSSGQTKMSTAEIIKGSEYPSVYDEYKKPGETITLKCTAPVGAEVTVKLGGTTYKMTPSKSGKAGSTLYSTTYSYTYKIPSYSDTGKIITIGAPVYTMKLNGKTSTRTADGIIKCITPGAPYYAEITSDTAFIYASNTTTGGPVGELSRGMRDYITAVTGNGAWVRLGMGYWVPLSDVKRTHESGALSASMTTAYEAGVKWDLLKFNLSLKSSVHAKYDGKNFIVTVYNVKSAPALTLPSGSCMESVSPKLDGNKAIYTFKPKDGVEGYYTELSGQTLNVYIKRKPSVTGNSLSGLTIMLDAGHGGTDPGAIGPLGNLLPEKTIALAATLRLAGELERLGAKVLLTRTSDVNMSLQARLEMNRAARPDLFLSLHINSMGEDVDSTSITGVSTWYKENVSKDIAGLLYERAYTELSRGKRGTHQSNLYVCRGTWCPSLIFEIGFISNPGEYEWMTDNTKQSEFVTSLTRGVVEYFS